MKRVKTEFLSSKLVRSSEQISNANILALVRDKPSKFSLRGWPESWLFAFFKQKMGLGPFQSDFSRFGAVFRTEMAIFRPKILKFPNGSHAYIVQFSNQILMGSSNVSLLFTFRAI